MILEARNWKLTLFCFLFASLCLFVFLVCSLLFCFILFLFYFHFCSALLRFFYFALHLFSLICGLGFCALSTAVDCD